MTVRNHFFSLIERLLPRLLSAGIVFVLAYYTSPFTVGLYSAVMLAYTFVQATVETAMRQVLPDVADDRRFLHRYVVFSAVVSPTFLLAVVGIVATQSWTREGPQILWLGLVALVPLFNALALPGIGRLQMSGAWSTLARSQTTAVVVAGGCSMLMIVGVSPIIGVSIFLPVAEGLNALLVRAAAAPVPVLNRNRGAPPGRELAAISALGSASWLQGQADRVLLSVLAGAAALGSLSVGSSMARAIGDPISGASSNLLRIELAAASDASEIRIVFDRVVQKSLILSAGAAIVVLLGAEVVARPVLGVKWGATIDLVPVLVIGVFFSTINASIGTLQVYLRRMRRATVIPLVALIFAPVVAVVAAHSLYTAAWLIVAREAAISVAAFISVRRHISPRMIRAAMLAAAAAAACALILQYLL